MECRNDSTASKVQCSVVVHEPTLTFILHSLMYSSPRCRFNGDGLDVHLGILFFAFDLPLTCFFPKEFSQPLHRHFRNTEYQSHNKGTLNAVCQVCRYTMLSSHLRLFWPPPHICRHVVLHYEAVCFYNLNIYIPLYIAVLYLHMDNALRFHYFHLTRRTPVTLISCVGHSGRPLRHSTTLH